MRKQISSMLITVLLLLALCPRADAAIGLGYETLVILPHAFTLNYWDKSSGWGVKASSDFGVSALSLAAKISSVFVKIFGGNLIDFSFYTLSITKDFSQEDNARAFYKFGALVFTGKSNNLSASVAQPIVGIGKEWHNFMFNGLTGSAELGYPELLTFGLRLYF